MTNPRFKKLKEILCRRQTDLTVLLEDVQKPHNLAAIARTCDAVAINEIHAVSEIRGLRLSQMAAGGIRKWVDLKKYKTTEQAFKVLKEKHMQIVVTHLSDNTIDYKEIDYTKPTAIVAGSEYEGVSDYAIEHADHCISIPMLGMVQSLNVSVAMSIILYEAQQQREKAGMYNIKTLPDETLHKKLFEGCHPKTARLYRDKQLPYPALNDDGDIILNND